MTERPHTWVLLGRPITVHGSPDSIVRVDEALHHLQKKVEGLRQLHPQKDELTLYLMGVVALLEELTGCLAEYETFCQAIETWLPSSETSSQV